VTSTTDAAVLLGAGVLAGIVGTSGGITSLISYPALLGIGIAPVPANVTNIVALVTTWPGSALASRPELRGKGPWLRRWALVAAAGGGVGAALLLSTPPGAFARVVPFLVAIASLGLVLQPRLSSWRAGRAVRGERFWLPCGLFAVSVYCGYFGAGAGVITLALLLLTVDGHLARANALKNMILGVPTVVSAAGFVLLGPVQWGAVLPLATGAFVGGTIGPRVARWAPADVLRWAVALIGLGLAVHLWLDPA
jgi:hypothetical protein